jgi:hypothetical protein
MHWAVSQKSCCCNIVLPPGVRAGSINNLGDEIWYRSRRITLAVVDEVKSKIALFRRKTRDVEWHPAVRSLQ